MMILLILLFGCTTVWLCYLVKAQTTKFSLEFTTTFKSLPQIIWQYIGIMKRVRDVISKLLHISSTILPYLLIIGFFIGGFYIFHRMGSALKIAILILGQSVIVLFILFFLYSYSCKRSHISFTSAKRSRVYSIKQFAYIGEAKLPKKLYEGDSSNISINLRQADWILEKNKHFYIRDSRVGKLVALTIQQDNRLDQFLEVELLAAGLTIDGEKKQKLLLNSERLNYRWNCHFSDSGKFMLNIIFRMVNPDNSSIEIGTIEHVIKVAKLDHLTQRQVWALATLAGTLSGGLAIIQALLKLNIW